MIHNRVPKLGQLRVFERVAAVGSISRAAEDVRRTQPAVTAALRRLEEHIGTELLTRHRGGSQPTNAGKILLARIERLFRQIESALLSASAGPHPPEPDSLRLAHTRLTSQHLRVLIAISEQTTLAEAARATEISKPSLYRTAQAIERLVGRALFVRTNRAFGVNRTGAELARQFGLALREIDYAREEIEAVRGQVASNILIGAVPLCAMQLLTDAVNALLNEHPGSQVRVADGSYDLLLRDLRHGKIDFLYGVLRCPEWAVDIEELPLLYDPYLIAMRSGHPLACKRHIRLDDLARFDWIVPRQGTPRRRAFDRLFQGHGTSPSCRIETSSLEFQLTILASSDRLTLMTSHDAHPQIAAGLLTTIRYDGVCDRLRDGVAIRRHWQPTAAQRRFLEILRQKAKLPDATGLALRRAEPRLLNAAP